MSERENIAAKLRTPWGDAAGLRDRKLYPGSGTPPGQVARNQRERCFAAVVAVVAQKGYEAMTVADILELSGVSRSAFYVHFANKGECLTAAAGELIEPALAAFDPAPGDDRAEPRRALEGFLALLGSQPAAARACFVDLHAAEPGGEAVADRAFEALTARAGALGQASGRPPLPTVLLQALIGGMRKMIQSRLVADELDELRAQAAQISAWIESVEAPPGDLLVPRRQRASPGGFQGYTPAERIARAVASLVAEKGYAATSTDDVAAAAAISLSTFYENFADKRDAVLGTLEMSGAQITALAVPAARRARGWQEGVRAFYEAIGHYFAAEPAMAELALVGVYGAGEEALRRRDRVIESLTTMLAPGLAENPSASPVAAEAAAAAAYSLMREQVRAQGPASIAAVIPLATYVTLAGFTGPERALAVANGEG